MTLESIMKFYGVHHYRYYDKEGILVIYESILVKYFRDIRFALKQIGLTLNNIMIKEGNYEEI